MAVQASDVTSSIARRVEYPERKEGGGDGTPVVNKNYELIKDVKVKISASVGGASLTVDELFDLKDGSVLKLDRQTADPVDIIMDGKTIARGELVVVDDNFGVRIVEILSTEGE